MNMKRPMTTKICNRYDTHDNWIDSDEIYLKGELLISEIGPRDVRVKIGDGKNKYKDLPYTNIEALKQALLIELRNGKNTRIKLKYDTSENWNNSNLILYKGEMGIEFTPDGTKIKIGNGLYEWKDLEYVSFTDPIMIKNIKSNTKQISDLKMFCLLNGFLSLDILIFLILLLGF